MVCRIPALIRPSGTFSRREKAEVAVLPLHGELSVEQQSAALQPDPQGRRRVVLATNVAESSVTLPGVRVVIDSGLAREPRYDPNSGFSRLEVVSISQASADQRAGRAGRVAEGWAYRLWPQSQRLEPQRRPEIAQVELASLALELAAWGSDDAAFRRSTARGRVVGGARPAAPAGCAWASDMRSPRWASACSRSARIRAWPRCCCRREATEDRALACDLAALVEARDPLRSGGDALAARWRALAAFRQGRVAGDAHRSGLAADRRGRQAMAPPACASMRAAARNRSASPWRPAGACLPRPHRPPASRRSAPLPAGQRTHGARCSTTARCSASHGSWSAELRFEARDALVLRAAPVDEAQPAQGLPATLRQRRRRALGCRSGARCRRSAKPASTRSCWKRNRPAASIRSHAAAALTDAVRELGLESLPWSDSLRQWRERVRCLHEWMPEAGFPDLSDRSLARLAGRLAAARLRRQDAARCAGRGGTRRSAQVAASSGRNANASTSSRPRASPCLRAWNARSSTRMGSRRCWR